jgi:hypothetical protein
LGTYRGRKNWTDVNTTPIFCEQEDGVVRIFDLAILVSKRSTLFEIVNDVIGHIIEGGILVPIKNRGVDEAILESKSIYYRKDRAQPAIFLN